MECGQVATPILQDAHAGADSIDSQLSIRIKISHNHSILTELKAPPVVRKIVPTMLDVNPPDGIAELYLSYLELRVAISSNMVDHKSDPSLHDPMLLDRNLLHSSPFLVACSDRGEMLWEDDPLPTPMMNSSRICDESTVSELFQCAFEAIMVGRILKANNMTLDTTTLMSTIQHLVPSIFDPRFIQVRFCNMSTSRFGANFSSGNVGSIFNDLDTQSGILFYNPGHERNNWESTPQHMAIYSEACTRIYYSTKPVL